MYLKYKKFFFISILSFGMLSTFSGCDPIEKIKEMTSDVKKEVHNQATQEAKKKIDEIYSDLTKENDDKKSEINKSQKNNELNSNSESNKSTNSIKVEKNQFSFEIPKDSLKMKDGSISLKLKINTKDGWILYSDKHTGQIGKKFEVFFFIKENNTKLKLDGEILKSSNQESLTFTKKGEVIGSKEDIEIKVFPSNSEMDISISDDKIIKDKKIIMEVSGGLCEKENNSAEPEICIPVHEEFELN